MSLFCTQFCPVDPTRVHTGNQSGNFETELGPYEVSFSTQDEHGFG